jgi:adenylyltransferase/sulfurtransferase
VLPQPEQAAAVADWEVTVTELKARFDRGESMTLIDVREPHEWQMCNLAAYGATLIPLGQFASRMQELDSAEEIVVHCKMGGRSAEAYGMLKQAGFPNIKNLKGGIVAWADEVDQTLPKY